MRWMHLILVQMPYKFGWKSLWCTTLVCRKHEDIPLHYKNITKHEKARTGVIVHLSFLEKRRAVSLYSPCKKGQWTPRKISEMLLSTMSNYYHSYNYYVTICYQLWASHVFSTSLKSEITLTPDKKKKKYTHFQNIKSNINWNKKEISKQAIYIYSTYKLHNTTHLFHPCHF